MSRREEGYHAPEKGSMYPCKNVPKNKWYDEFRSTPPTPCFELTLKPLRNTIVSSRLLCHGAIRVAISHTLFYLINQSTYLFLCTSPFVQIIAFHLFLKPHIQSPSNLEMIFSIK